MLPGVEPASGAAMSDQSSDTESESISRRPTGPDERQRVPCCAGPSQCGGESAGPTRAGRQHRGWPLSTLTAATTTTSLPPFEEAPSQARPRRAGRSLSARGGRRPRSASG
ncbi:unnamed protein product [Prorocentrum cordatum]|uniref:Uncharacterized protein n=1 Tax=Prorocentrum cordatum TaxID=2364126 RepID=A0ABN9WKW8_9DINO|nr:unnamed protein product [Polarella glacialis]CAK0885967.1 unnamed protein product [Polarella glacialis]